MQIFTCPMCGEDGEAYLNYNYGQDLLIWDASCTNRKCNGYASSEILADSEGLFPVDEWEENYDKF